MVPTKEQMYQWYVVEKKSYRQIMKLIGTKNNRKVRKLLEQYDIPIRRGSEAVKTQWLNNDKRRKKQGEVFAEYHRGKPSNRRIPLSELQKRYDLYNIKIHKRKIVSGYTLLECECLNCGYKFERSLKNTGKGCFKCSAKVNGKKQRRPFEEVQKLFNDMGLVLISTKYVRSSDDLEYICPDHSIKGIMKISYDKLMRRYNEGRKGCRYCTYDSMRNTELHKSRNSWMYEEWRESVFKRDDYTCQCCNDNKGGNLRAHHIRNFSEYEQGRFDINNGITLCDICHDPEIEGSFHYVYGTRNNNREQLEEYIKSRQLALF